MADLKKLFVFVPDAQVANFKAAHANQAAVYYTAADADETHAAGSVKTAAVTKDATDAYFSKISFLGSTGEILARGEIYGANTDSALDAIQAEIDKIEGSDTTDGSIAKAVADLKKTIVGTSTTQADGTTETLTSLDDRVDSIETALNVAGTDTATIDKIDEVLTWFAGIKESDPVGSAVITATSAVGTKGSGDTASTGLIKDVEDLQAVGATKTEASTTNGNIKIDGTETTVYTHHTQDAATAAAVKVGNDSEGHVVLGDALVASDITATAITADDDTVGVAGTDVAAQIADLAKTVKGIDNHSKTTVADGSSAGTLKVDGTDVAISQFEAAGAVKTAIEALDTTADVQAVTLTAATTTDGAKLVFNGVKEADGVISAGELTSELDLALVATTGAAANVTVSALTKQTNSELEWAATDSVDTALSKIATAVEANATALEDMDHTTTTVATSSTDGEKSDYVTISDGADASSNDHAYTLKVQEAVYSDSDDKFTTEGLVSSTTLTSVLGDLWEDYTAA